MIFIMFIQCINAHEFYEANKGELKGRKIQQKPPCLIKYDHKNGDNSFGANNNRMFKTTFFSRKSPFHSTYFPHQNLNL